MNKVEVDAPMGVNLTQISPIPSSSIFPTGFAEKFNGRALTSLRKELIKFLEN